TGCPNWRNASGSRDPIAARSWATAVQVPTAQGSGTSTPTRSATPAGACTGTRNTRTGPPSVWRASNSASRTASSTLSSARTGRPQAGARAVPPRAAGPCKEREPCCRLWEQRADIYSIYRLTGAIRKGSVMPTLAQYIAPPAPPPAGDSLSFDHQWGGREADL